MVIVRDLYAIDFDPVLKADERPDAPHWSPSGDVAVELEFLRQADILVLVYPIWYGLPPAILKGYVDRVLGANYSFHRFRDQAGQASLVGKPLLSFSTSGTPLAWLHERSQVLALREIFDVYLWRREVATCAANRGRDLREARRRTAESDGFRSLSHAPARGPMSRLNMLSGARSPVRDGKIPCPGHLAKAISQMMAGNAADAAIACSSDIRGCAIR